MKAIAWQDRLPGGGLHLIMPEFCHVLVLSTLRGPLNITERNHPLPGLAWLLQGLTELRVGHRGPAGLPHQDHI